MDYNFLSSFNIFPCNFFFFPHDNIEKSLRNKNSLKAQNWKSFSVKVLSFFMLVEKEGSKVNNIAKKNFISLNNDEYENCCCFFHLKHINLIKWDWVRYGQPFNKFLRADLLQLRNIFLDRNFNENILTIS